MFTTSSVLRLRVLLVAGLIAVTPYSAHQAANAQTTTVNEWAWMGGSNTGYGTAQYGTLGTPAAVNIPGDRYYASSWTDSNGNLWLFGGQGEDAEGKWGYLNDLWEFNPSTNEWAWMGGSSAVPLSCGNSNPCGQSGEYGTLGTLAAGNIPGGRCCFSSWTDSSGHIWLFGGNGFDANGTFTFYLNDLWELYPSTNEWAWMGGSSTVPYKNYIQPGVYGALGTPAAGNIPGGRGGAASWTDSKGNFWLFGGGGAPNDLWEFNPSLGANGEWAWMGGSSTLPSNGIEPGVYGTLGTPAAGNFPGGRNGAASWTDSSGNLWLFGGYGVPNDLWKYQLTATNLRNNAGGNLSGDGGL
jgi:hypothetical protein